MSPLHCMYIFVPQQTDTDGILETRCKYWLGNGMELEEKPKLGVAFGSSFDKGPHQLNDGGASCRCGSPLTLTVLYNTQ